MFIICFSAVLQVVLICDINQILYMNDPFLSNRDKINLHLIYLVVKL